VKIERNENRNKKRMDIDSIAVSGIMCVFAFLANSFHFLNYGFRV